jgi:hypothetical protein
MATRGKETAVVSRTMAAFAIVASMVTSGCSHVTVLHRPDASVMSEAAKGSAKERVASGLLSVFLTDWAVGKNFKLVKPRVTPQGVVSTDVLVYETNEEKAMTLSIAFSDMKDPEVIRGDPYSNGNHLTVRLTLANGNLLRFFFWDGSTEPVALFEQRKLEAIAFADALYVLIHEPKARPSSAAAQPIPTPSPPPQVQSVPSVAVARSIPTPSPLPQAQSGRSIIVAVFDIEDASHMFNPVTFDQLTDVLATKLTEVAGFKTVPRDQLRRRLQEEKKESLRVCYDQSCQIELGKSLAAQKSLATKVVKVGETCVINSRLYNLKTETADAAASLETDCSEKALLKAVGELAVRLGRTAR